MDAAKRRMALRRDCIEKDDRSASDAERASDRPCRVMTWASGGCKMQRSVV